MLYLPIIRDWDEYETGFGKLHDNVWIGLSNLHKLTNQPTELHVYLRAFDNETRYARYCSFSIVDSSNKYSLSIAGCSWSAGNLLLHHNGREFSTYDNDNDNAAANCAVTYEPLKP